MNSETCASCGHRTDRHDSEGFDNNELYVECGDCPDSTCMLQL